MRYRSLVLLGTLAIVLSASACTKYSKTSSNTNAATVTTKVNTNSADSSFSTSGNSNTNSSTNTRVVTVSASGIQSNPLTVVVGTTVTFVNNDSVAHHIASDPHPVHTDLPGFDTGTIASGASAQYTFVKVGNWAYHDHLDASNSLFRGTVIVTQ